MTPDQQALDQRILVRAATTRDATMAAAVLERAHFTPHVCADMQELVQQLSRGAGALMLAEEALAGNAGAGLSDALRAQPPWSDLPVLVLARQGADSRAIVNAMDELANVTVIERPMRIASLVSAARTALRARGRQYELRDLLGGLHEADQRKTEFLATLAHELRNPLAPLGTALALLARKQPQGAEAQKYYELMGRQVDHMVHLVNDLMEVSRITRGKIDLHTGTVALGAVVHDAIELSRPLVEGAGHQLAVELPAEDLVIRGDSVRLTQVFSNLLNNAAKYTPAGGQVALRARREGTQAVVEVSDSGAGLAPHMLLSIFDMFVQVSGTSKAAQGGLGIGLTLVKSLVELHGGSVAADSAGLGRGARFTVRLPLAESTAAAAPGHAAPAGGEPAAIAKTILVVDDNRDAADILEELLSSLGADTRVAYDGEEALRLAQRQRPDVAILDIGMPAMDGCELARQLRAGPDGGSMVLIALTGWGQQGDRDRIAAAGFDHHLLKPLDLAQLLPLL